MPIYSTRCRCSSPACRWGLSDRGAKRRDLGTGTPCFARKAASCHARIGDLSRRPRQYCRGPTRDGAVRRIPHWSAPFFRFSLPEPHARRSRPGGEALADRAAQVMRAARRFAFASTLPARTACGPESLLCLRYSDNMLCQRLPAPLTADVRRRVSVNPGVRCALSRPVRGFGADEHRGVAVDDHRFVSQGCRFRRIDSAIGEELYESLFVGCLIAQGYDEPIIKDAPEHGHIVVFLGVLPFLFEVQQLFS